MDRLKKYFYINLNIEATLENDAKLFFSQQSKIFFIETKYKSISKLIEKISFNLNDFKFNNVTICYDECLKNFSSKQFYGVNFYFISVIESRVELNIFSQYNLYKFDRWYVFKSFILDLIPVNKYIFEKVLINLNFLFLIKSYRGWRHTFNLPSRGQRTWSNAWSVFKSKNIFRSYQYSCFCLEIVNAHPDELKSAFFLEQLNLLWKSQWEKEWLIAIKRRNAQLKKNPGLKKLELNLMSKTNPNFIKNKKNNLIPIGFESGFTKSYLKDIKQLLVKKPRINKI